MKYQKGKVKKEHNILSDFKYFINDIGNIDDIKRIIPGRIYRKQKGTSDKNISFSYFTDSGMKYNFKKGSTAQEIFIVCSNKKSEGVKKEIDNKGKIYGFISF